MMHPSDSVWCRDEYPLDFTCIYSIDWVLIALLSPVLL